MTIVRCLKAALAASPCLLPLPALAQDDNGFDIGDKPASMAQTPAATNWIDFGGQYNSSRSYYLNRFNGAVNPGFYGIGDFHLGGRDAWDSGGTQYWSMDGTDMGLQDRSVIARAGQQGTWGLTLSYDGIPYYASNEFKSVWTASGATVPGVAPGSLPLVFPARPQYPAYRQANGVVLNSLWLPSPNGSLAGALYDYNIGTMRDVFAGTGKYQWNDWTITGSIRHEHKTGYQANSLEIGGTVGLTVAGTGGLTNGRPAATTGVTSGLGYFAQPIDYDTDRYDLTAAYGTQRFQVQLGYMFSKFTDNLAAFNAQNPFAFTPTTAFGTSPANLSAPYALPPSNSAHQVKAMVGYNFSPTTRVNANVAYGLQMQNAPYVEGTGNAGANPYQPRASYAGLVQTMYGNIAVVTQPISKLDIRVSYTIDNRDNQSPSNAYGVDTRSVTAVNAGGDCAFAGGLCVSLPFSFNHQTISAEAGYRILPQTKLTLNDTFETTYRNYADVSFVTSNTVTAKIRSQLVDDLFGALSYSHQDRDANNHANGNTWMFFTNGGVEPDITGTVMYFEASRTHDEVKATLDFSPIHSLNTTVMTKFSHDSYPGTTYGLRDNHNFLVGPDVSWDVSAAVNAHAYYTYQQIYYEQSSLYTSGTAFGPTGTGYYVPWTNKTTDSVHTFGMTADWRAIPEVLKISFIYSFSYGDTAYALGDGMAMIGGGQTSQATLANLTLQSLPDVTSMLNMISVRGEYTFRPNWTVIFGYEFERFSYKDFMNNAGSTQYANAVMPGTLNPNDSIHVIGAGLRIRF
jgi:MtrB/PioB family decaheme-associated outer membrane protein